jgi:cytochrome c-type biogenesis protein CcmH
VRVALPLLVLAVALVIGSGVFSAQRQTAAQRAARIEAGVRCPACIDVSVAQSNDSTALAVRHQILRMVERGDITAQIDRTLVAQYGQTILLVPPSTGGVALIWVLPIALAVGAVTFVGVLFVRRSRQFGALRDQEAAVAPAGPSGNSD